MSKDELRTLIEECNDDKKILNYRGKLIKLLKKEIKETENKKIKDNLNLELIEELTKHKAHISTMLNNKQKYSIPERVGLKVKEIAKTIEIFMQKEDILGKLKKGALSTVTSSLFISAITLAISSISGPVTLATLASLLPTFSYIGLSNIISSLFSETQKSKYLKNINSNDELVKKLKDFNDKYIVNNKEFIMCLTNDEKIEDLVLKIENEKKIVNHYKIMIQNAPNEEMENILTLELVDIMKKLEDNYEKLESRYLCGEINLSDKDIDKFIDEKRKNEIELFEKSNFIKKTGINIVENVGKNASIMYISRMILSAFFPSLSFKNLNDVISPFVYMIINNVLNSGNFAKSIKMKKTNYTNTLIKLSNPDFFNKQLNENIKKVNTI